MKVTAKQIAEGLQGEIIGDENVEVSAIAKIEEGRPETISFLAFDKYMPYLESTQSSIVLISKSLVPQKEVKPTLIVVDDAHSSFVNLLDFYNQFINNLEGIDEKSSIHESATYGEGLYVGAFAVVSENVKIGNNCKVYPNVFIGKNVEIGDNVTLEPNVVVFNDCKIGNKVTIHSGTVIGSDGFGFLPEENGYKKVPQLGNVIIEDNVEIGSNATIDRATMGSTVIKEGVKLDNLIQIAHNVEIGKHTVIAAQAGVAGSTRIGEWNMIGGQVGIVGHIKLGNKIQIQAQSGVNKNFPDGSQIYGSPAMIANDFRKNYVYFRKLSQLADKIDALEKEIEKLNQANNG